jgi:phosphoglycolate phosphatase
VNYKVVLFDFSGTLCDTRDAVVECVTQTLLVHEVPTPERSGIERRLSQGATLFEALRALVFDGRCGDAVDPQTLLETFRSLLPHIAPLRNSLYHGVRETLPRILERSNRCIIISNKDESTIQRVLRDAGLGRSDLPMTVHTHPRSKPNPSAFMDIMARAFPTLTNADYLMVGDTRADLRFARRAKIASCWASYGYGDSAACEALAPDHILTSFVELPNILGLK